MFVCLLSCVSNQTNQHRLSMEAFTAYTKSSLASTSIEEGRRVNFETLSRSLEAENHGAGDGAVDEAAVGDHEDELCNQTWSGTEGLVVLAVALFCGVFARLVLHRTKIPFAVLLTCSGGLLGVLHDVVYKVTTNFKTI